MTIDTLPPLLMRWVHVLVAVVAVGGLVYQRFVLLPAIRALPEQERLALLRERIARRWRVVVAASIVLLVGSGLYNFVVVSLPTAADRPGYHMLFGIKVSLAVIVFFLASALAGRSPAFQGMRDNARVWGALTAALGASVVLLGGALKLL